MARSSVKPKVTYSDELALKICETIENSREGLRVLCKENPDWPSPSNVYVWLDLYPFFQDRYARARVRQAEALVSEIIHIAFDDSKDTFIDEEGKYQTNNASIQRSRVKIDAIKWIACKLVPKIYGERREDKNNNEDAISQFRVENE